MHTLIWILAAVALALWSLLVWGLSALPGLEPGWAQALQAWLAQGPFAGWLDGWMPGWRGLLAALLDGAQSLLAGLGAAGRWLMLMLWGAGALAVLGGAALLSLFVALVDKVPQPRRDQAADAVNPVNPR